MGLHRVIMDSQAPNIFIATIAPTTAGTSQLIASITAGSIYITDIIISNGPTAGNVLLGIGTAGTTPTGSAVLMQPAYLAINSSLPLTGLGTPIKVANGNNIVVTAVSNTTMSVTAIYYIAP